jgi:hypothetical protein
MNMDEMQICLAADDSNVRRFDLKGNSSASICVIRGFTL